MALLGVPASAVLSAADRAPVWANGVRGSLTHSREYAAAGVSTSLAGLGIDLEHFGRLSARAAERILVADEASALDAFPHDPLWLATLVFSAKESVYKAIYPAAGVYIGYREVMITLDLRSQAFSATYIGPNAVNKPLDGGRGHWWLMTGAVLTRFEIGGA